MRYNSIANWMDRRIRRRGSPCSRRQRQKSAASSTSSLFRGARTSPTTRDPPAPPAAGRARSIFPPRDFIPPRLPNQILSRERRRITEALPQAQPRMARGVARTFFSKMISDLPERPAPACTNARSPRPRRRPRSIQQPVQDSSRSAPCGRAARSRPAAHDKEPLLGRQHHRLHIAQRDAALALL